MLAWRFCHRPLCFLADFDNLDYLYFQWCLLWTLPLWQQGTGVTFVPHCFVSGTSGDSLYAIPGQSLCRLPAWLAWLGALNQKGWEKHKSGRMQAMKDERRDKQQMAFVYSWGSGDELFLPSDHFGWGAEVLWATILVAQWGTSSNLKIDQFCYKVLFRWGFWVFRGTGQSWPKGLSLSVPSNSTDFISFVLFKIQNTSKYHFAWCHLDAPLSLYLLIYVTPTKTIRPDRNWGADEAHPKPIRSHTTSHHCLSCQHLKSQLWKSVWSSPSIFANPPAFQYIPIHHPWSITLITLGRPDHHLITSPKCPCCTSWGDSKEGLTDLNMLWQKKNL